MFKVIIFVYFYLKANLNSILKPVNVDKNILLSHTTELEDETFEETEMMNLRNDKKRRKNRLDFFCSKPSIIY